MSNLSEIHYKIALNRIEGIGGAISRLLISHSGGVAEVFQLKKRDLLAINGIGEQTANLILNADVLELSDPILALLDKHESVKLLFYTDSDYPQRLTHFDQSPTLFYYDGSTDLNAHRTVSIIGTRNCNEYGILQCEKLVEGLHQYGVQIISGLAYGIDVTAHRKAVEFGIPNIAVLGSGIDVIYPSSHFSLSQRIKANGGLMSQFEFGTKPDRQNFPSRNQVVAAMSDAVVVVQSRKSGGSMITAHMASEMNKDVFAVPGRATDEVSKGCNTLIKRNRAHLITEAEDIAYIMGWEPKEKLEAQLKLFEELDSHEMEIVQILQNYDTLDIDSLHHQLSRPLSSLSSDLLTLEFKGLVKSLPGKRYTLI